MNWFIPKLTHYVMPCKFPHSMHLLNWYSQIFDTFEQFMLLIVESDTLRYLIHLNNRAFICWINTLRYLIHLNNRAFICWIDTLRYLIHLSNRAFTCWIDIFPDIWYIWTFCAFICWIDIRRYLIHLNNSCFYLLNWYSQIFDTFEQFVLLKHGLKAAGVGTFSECGGQTWLPRVSSKAPYLEMPPTSGFVLYTYFSCSK
jgi:hypothetical protein